MQQPRLSLSFCQRFLCSVLVLLNGIKLISFYEFLLPVVFIKTFGPSRTYSDSNYLHFIFRMNQNRYSLYTLQVWY